MAQVYSDTFTVDSLKTISNKGDFLLKILLGIFMLLLLSTIIVLLTIYVIVPEIETARIDETCNLKINTGGIHSTLGKYKRSAVASDTEVCSTVGKNILLKNGSAVDAAIAAAVCMGSVNSHASGIGGGHFMVIYINNTIYSINAREKAPANAYENMFLDNPWTSVYGGLATAIPGEVFGLWEAYKIGGKLPWTDLFAPTIKMCLEGFEVTFDLDKNIKLSEKEIRMNKGLSEIFINEATNETFKRFDKIKLPKLAKTLLIIAENNVSAFYSGSLAKKMVREINENGGNVTLDDFKSYKTLVQKPIQVDLDDHYVLYTPPPPASGILVSLIMRVMKKFDVNNQTLSDENKSTLFYHRLIETFKHTFYKRSFLGDGHVENITQVLKELLDEKLVNEIRSKIKDSRTYPSSFYGPEAGSESHGTSHLSVLADGDAVSLTSSISSHFGAKYVGETTGIVYNNQMNDFEKPNDSLIKPSMTNYIKPNKRPMSSASPIIIVDKNNNNVRLVLGASGGNKIITAVAQVGIKNLWIDNNIKANIDNKKVHHQLYPERVLIEMKFNNDVRHGLQKIGHSIRCTGILGQCQGITKLELNRVEASSDARKGGQPDGF